MMRFAANAFLFATMLLFSPASSYAAPQTPQAADAISPSATYKLMFVITQISGGKIAGRRSYTALFQPDIHSAQRGVIHATDTFNRPDPNNYKRVGVEVDFNVDGDFTYKPDADHLPLFITAQIDSFVPQSNATDMASPYSRSTEYRSLCDVKLGKPTLIFSSDSPTTDETTQVELTATRVKSD